MSASGVALLFPGQGSQYVGMGRELADAFPAAARVFDEADEILGFELSRLMREGPEDELVLTRNAQPAILTHSVAVLRLVRDRLGPVGMAAGHSLGEFSAHVAAGTVSFADAVRTVRLRGELMQEAGTRRAGTMAAVLGLPDEIVVALCDRASRGPDSVVVPANFNSPGQVVISGDVDAVRRAGEIASEEGARKFVQLSVSGAFHSPLMKPAEAGLYEALGEIAFEPPAFPVYSNVTAAPVLEPAPARALLTEQLTQPVRWADCVRAMLATEPERFVELGPGRVLRGLNRRIERGADTVSLGEPSDLESLTVEAS